MRGLGTPHDPAFDHRDLPIELVAAGYEANAADTDYADTGWAGGNRLNYRKAAEAVRNRHADAFQALEAQGPYDVRVFSSLPDYRPRGGVVCIISGLTLREARRALAVEKGEPDFYAGLYFHNTARRATYTP